MKQELNKKLLSIIHNPCLSLEEQINKLLIEIENVRDLPILKESINLVDLIEQERLGKDFIINEDKIKISDSLFEHEIGSINKQELIVFAGSSGCGKTQFLIHFVNQLSENHGVLFHTLNDNLSFITRRFIGNECDETHFLLRKMPLDAKNYFIDESLKSFQNKKIYLTDNPIISWYQIKNYYKNLVEKIGIEIIVIEDINYISVNSFNFRNDVKNIRILLKRLKIN